MVDDPEKRELASGEFARPQSVKTLRGKQLVSFEGTLRKKRGIGRRSYRLAAMPPTDEALGGTCLRTRSTLWSNGQALKGSFIAFAGCIMRKKFGGEEIASYPGIQGKQTCRQ